MDEKPINFREKFDQFYEFWSPKIIAEMNDYQFKVVKVKGEFVWHDHKETDEVFMVIQGQMSIEFRDGKVDLSAGEMFVVRRRVEHKPYAEEECHVLVIEPQGVVNTGDKKNRLTAKNDVWI